MKPTLPMAILYGGLMAAATLSALHPQRLVAKSQFEAQALLARVEARFIPASVSPQARCSRTTAPVIDQRQMEAFAHLEAAQACRRAQLAKMRARIPRLQLALVRLQAASASWSAEMR